MARAGTFATVYAVASAMTVRLGLAQFTSAGAVQHLPRGNTSPRSVAQADPAPGERCGAIDRRTIVSNPAGTTGSSGPWHVGPTELPRATFTTEGTLVSAGTARVARRAARRESRPSTRRRGAAAGTVTVVVTG